MTRLSDQPSCQPVAPLGRQVSRGGAPPEAAPADGGVINCLTIDLEDYYHCEVFARTLRPEQWDGCVDRLSVTVPPLLDMLAEHGARATFFVLGWVAARQPALIRRIAAAGHEIASHGFNHQHLGRMTPARFAADLRDSRAAIEDAVGSPVRGYRAPTFSITRQTAWAVDVLCEQGFEYDSSVFPIHHDRYGVPNAPTGPYWLTGTAGRILELPPLTLKVGPINLPAAGGGYLRLLPTACTELAIRRANARHQPAVLYFHPWELDPHQPHLPMGRLPRLRHTVGIVRMPGKLRRLMARHRFRPIGELAEQWACMCQATHALLPLR